MGMVSRAMHEGKVMGLRDSLVNMAPEERAEAMAYMEETDPGLYAEVMAIMPVGELRFTVSAGEDEHGDS